MKEKSNELSQVLQELELLIKEFTDLQKITNANKQGKIKLSDEKMKNLEQKYLDLTNKMEELNKKAKKLKNEG